jgi:4-hydroxy-tetrahydrodipicolinate synthase
MKGENPTMNNTHWQGVFPAITTQFKKDQTLDLAATARHAEELIESGVAGIIFLGSLGENQALRADEKRELIHAMVAAVNGRVPVLSGVAESSTAEACRYVKDVEKLGINGLMLMPAMLYRGDPRETMAHFVTTAKATGLPIMIYNNPISYANDITAEMFAELAEVENFVALKESSGDTRRITAIHNLLPGRFAIFTGVDDLVLESAILGIDGWVAGSGIAFPAENQYFWELTRAGQWEKAREIYRWFTPLLRLDVHTKFVQYIKLAVQECGLGSEWVRAPRLPLVGAERQRILKVIQDGIAARPAIPKRQSLLSSSPSASSSKSNGQARGRGRGRGGGGERSTRHPARPHVPAEAL